MATPDAAVPRLVVVDDTDPAIRYSGAFSLDSTGRLDTEGYGGPVFNRTITGTTTNGTISYNFKGSYVRVVIAATGESGWSCNVDNHLLVSFTVDSAQVTNYIACDSAGTLADSTAEHTLDINFSFTPTSPHNSSLWLDSIQYQPLLSDPLDAVTLRIHNSDPFVSYSNSSGAWSYQGVGSNATDRTETSMSFNFNGTSASLYSVIWKGYNPTTAFYSIAGKSTNFDLPGGTTVANTGQQADVQNWPLFTTSDLPPSQYSLEVATAYNTTTYPQYLTISYFIIKTNPANSSSTGGSSNSAGNSGSSGSSGSSVSGHSTSKVRLVSTLVGAIVGSIVVIAVISYIIRYFRKRQRRDWANIPEHDLEVLPLNRFELKNTPLNEFDAEKASMNDFDPEKAPLNESEPQQLPPNRLDAQNLLPNDLRPRRSNSVRSTVD
ncbi:hypothetical protein GYMLUDRAFT_43323 [Collybiopsis luxurians FD-317 M1]|uniref:Unplaced genomic scaffold GYMLUscaffold_24, whole genome shotgun sequence n=1 Tax=Collybiopsis luxurians FD-317 M1 TaxID=944289 RepID=A0A0D0CY57_9AGAR|nr:hypothetical protein GYMLUDRAFT_43323 [Collybiopsis luxurians FD-317 M1]